MSQFSEHKAAAEVLKQIEKNPTNYRFIHYSCESFIDIKDGHTPRITSIAIRNIETAQTESFSLHKVAEQSGILMNGINREYDVIEKQMLDEYFNYLGENKDKVYIHINMRDINYGFKAIEHRYKVLKGSPFILADSQKIDFARLLIQKYGSSYIEHPRMESLYKFNGMNPRFFLTGQQEAEAFAKHEYFKLHQSTLSKVDVYSNLLNKAIKGTLKTKAKWYQVYGITPGGIYEYSKTQWWIQLIWNILILFLGAYLGHIIK